MKKNILLIILLIIIAFESSYIIINEYKENSVLETSSESFSNLKNSSLAIMVEQDDGTYLSDNTEVWKNRDYIFNDSLSKCEHGGNIYWDRVKGKITLEATSSDKCYAYFDIYSFSYPDSCNQNSKELLCKIKEKYGTDDSLVLHNSSLSNGANDGSYRFSGGEYINTSSYSSIAGSYKNYSDASQYLINFYCDDTLKPVYGACSTSQSHYFTLNNENSTHYLTLKETLNAAIQRNFVTKAEINNYVCFGSDEIVCSESNLYRIIGIIDNKIKLIKYTYATATELGNGTISSDYAGEYSTNFYGGVSTNNELPYTVFHWNTHNYDISKNSRNEYHVWRKSSLNNDHLNNYFLNEYLSEKWETLIDLTTWYIYGFSYYNLDSLKNIYNYEVGPYKDLSPSYDDYKPLDAKVGLLYFSEYGFAFDKTLWSGLDFKNEFDVDVISKNWLFSGYYEWTISRQASGEKTAFPILYTGGSSNGGFVTGVGIVRPTFNLIPSVKVYDGTGAHDDPYRIY